MWYTEREPDPQAFWAPVPENSLSSGSGICAFGAGRRCRSPQRFRCPRFSGPVSAPADVILRMVIPAGFEPGISALKERRPVLLVEGTISAPLPELTVCHAEARVTPQS